MACAQLAKRHQHFRHLFRRANNHRIAWLSRLTWAERLRHRAYRKFKRRRVTSDRFTSSEHVIPGGAQHLRLDGPCGVPGVGVLGDEAQHAWLLGSDQDTRATVARSTWAQECVLDLVVTSLEGDVLAAKHSCDDRQRLLEAAGEVIVGIAEGGIFRLVPSRAQPEDESPTADL